MGKMMEKDQPLLHVRVGEANSTETGNTYECLLVNGHLPTIKSKKTGKTYCVSWGELVAWAVEKGIDTEEEVA